MSAPDLHHLLAWSGAMWETQAVPLLREGWPGLIWRPASAHEDWREVTDYHLRFAPGGREWRVQWRVARWAGYATFTRKDSRADRATAAVERDKLAAGAPVDLWAQLYLTRSDPARPLAMGIARARLLQRHWGAGGFQRYNPHPGASGGLFSAIEFTAVTPRWEWRPHTGWVHYAA